MILKPPNYNLNLFTTYLASKFFYSNRNLTKTPLTSKSRWLQLFYPRIRAAYTGRWLDAHWSVIWHVLSRKSWIPFELKHYCITSMAFKMIFTEYIVQRESTDFIIFLLYVNLNLSYVRMYVCWYICMRMHAEKTEHESFTLYFLRSCLLLSPDYWLQIV